MSSSIGDFSKFTGATQVQYEGTGSVVASGAKPETKWGQFVAWLFRGADERRANTETTQKFVESLKTQFGEKIANTASAGLASHLAKGKPLTGRRIHEVIGKAEQLEAKLPKKEANLSQQEGLKPKTLPTDPREPDVKNALGFRYITFMMNGLSGLKQAGLAGCNLTNPEIASIHGYTTSDRSCGYTQMNGALRNYKTGDTSLGPLESVIKSATTGLDKLPDYGGPVFRVMSGSIESHRSIMNQYQKGVIIAEKGFTSTSHAVPESLTQGTYSGQHAFLIESLHGKKIESLSANPNEAEVLFKPCSRFEVTDRIEHPSGSVLIKMREVADEAQHK